MDLELQNKIALVSGSTDGIGFAIAKILAQEGATVYINGRSHARVEQAIERLNKETNTQTARAAVFDLSNKEGVEAIIQSIPFVDILVNNLGIYEVKPFSDITDQDWMRFFEVNVLSGVRLSRYYFPKMKEKNWGRIIFISSESGANIPSDMIHYGTTKSAQLAIARGLAETTVGTHITVNSILPGPTYTTGVQEYINQVAREKNKSVPEVEQDLFKELRPSSLIKRFAQPDEVAALVAFVCSKKAAAINGAALRVEGGILRSII